MTKSKLIGATLAAIATTTIATHAGPPAPAPEKNPAPLKSRVSGTLSLTVDTHFISYGADVWAAGSEWSDPLFHPQLEVSIAFSDKFKMILGTWWDVNDNAISSIGGSVQEIDVWAGFAYTAGPVTYTLLYQEWMYANDSERIIDFKAAFDTFLKPYILIHGRVDGIDAQEEGIVGVVGASYDFSGGPVNFSIPAALAFATDEYHGGGGGFAYASLGFNASLPLKGFFDGTTINAGVTYYHTNDDVIPNNPDSDFVTGSVGVSFSF
jgi:hypothetical protein